MRQRWTAERTQQLRDWVARTHPKTPREWDANPCGVSGKAAGVQWSRVRGDSPNGNISTHNGNTVVSPSEINSITGVPPIPVVPPALHVKKLHVHIPPPIAVTPSKLLRAVVYGDTHIPFQDDAALRVVAEVVRIVQPDVLCHDGDLLDCYHLSRFDTNPKRIHRLQDEIDAARQHLAAFRLLAPQARFVFLEGNHCDRLRRALWSMPPHAKALTELNAVNEALTWPKLLGLEEMGIEFYAYGEQTKAKILPKWILKHGSVVRKLSAYTARAEWERYGKSGSSGHTHRLGMFMHRDHNGAHCWVETGCTCSLTPEYVEDPDWAQGCLVLTFEPTTGAFQAEPVYIHQGTTVFRGQWIDARET